MPEQTLDIYEFIDHKGRETLMEGLKGIMKCKAWSMLRKGKPP